MTAERERFGPNGAAARNPVIAAVLPAGLFPDAPGWLLGPSILWILPLAVFAGQLIHGSIRRRRRIAAAVAPER